MHSYRFGHVACRLERLGQRGEMMTGRIESRALLKHFHGVSHLSLRKRDEPCQSPYVRLAVLVLLVCPFARRVEQHARAAQITALDVLPSESREIDRIDVVVLLEDGPGLLQLSRGRGAIVTRAMDRRQMQS